MCLPMARNLKNSAVVEENLRPTKTTVEVR
jgi:hypothetical protein